MSRAPRTKLLAASMRAGRVEDVDAGHLVPLERPELVVAAVETFGAEAEMGLRLPPPFEAERD